ncbi:MAG TPA: hypothetical protein VM512_07975 [Burkholderiaceae bacterium]|jgi:hypothetical protein|nr:hypothetical protein [Burkholderiaceae bacterium]
MPKVVIQKGGRSASVDDRLADLLVARGGYQRRDMVALPTARLPINRNGPEVDSEGRHWDPEIHTANHAKTQAGTWKKKTKVSSQK